MSLPSAASLPGRPRALSGHFPVIPEADSVTVLLDRERARAEMLLNGVRAVVLVLLGLAALLYAPQLTAALRIANLAILAPLLVWTAGQHFMLHRRGRRAPWLAVVNPIVDVTAVTLVMGAYGLIQEPALALNSPLFLVYFVILAARPITSSTRMSGVLTVLAMLQYMALLALLVGSDRVLLVSALRDSEVLAMPGVTVLDQFARLLLLGVAGAVATYATSWHERVMRATLTADVLRKADDRALGVQLQAADKLAAVGALAASVAHEVANPLTSIAVLADMLARSASDPAARDDAATISAEARRTVDVIRDLLGVVRPQTEPAGPVAIDAVVERALSLVRLMLRDAHVTGETYFARGLPPVVGDSSRLEQVVLNLILNSVHELEQMPGERVIRVSAWEEGEGVILMVEDSGPGFRPGARERCFDRFFTTKPAGKGTGLGLWIVRQIVEEHGGRVEAAIGEIGGAAFRIWLPASHDGISLSGRRTPEARRFDPVSGAFARLT